MIALTIDILTINMNIYLLRNLLHKCVLVMFKLQHQGPASVFTRSRKWRIREVDSQNMAGSCLVRKKKQL